jgi:hypothetical protein
VTEQSWKPTFRAPDSTITRVLRSASFAGSRERASEIMDDPTALRQLAQAVRSLNYTDAPLSAIADRVAAGYRLVLARADLLESQAVPARSVSPGGSARERLVVAALLYLITPIDVLPDFRVGGYLDDVLLLSWVFGAAVAELEPYLVDDLEDDAADDAEV